MNITMKYTLIGLVVILFLMNIKLCSDKEGLNRRIREIRRDSACLREDLCKQGDYILNHSCWRTAVVEYSLNVNCPNKGKDHEKIEDNY